MSTTTTTTSTLEPIPSSPILPSSTPLPPSSKETHPPRTARPSRPNYNEIHAQPLPLTIYPIPAFIPHNPLSLLRIVYAYLSPYLSVPHQSSHSSPYRAYYDIYTQAIHVTDPDTVRALWEKGFWGKGSLSRSEPEWKKKWEAARRGAGKVDTAAEVTRKRREERRREKLERARREAEFIEETLKREKEGLAAGEKPIIGLARQAEARRNLREGGSEVPTTDVVVAPGVTFEVVKDDQADDEALTSTAEQEHLQLTASEAFFLHYALGVLSVYPSTFADNNDTISEKPFTTTQLLETLRRSSTFPPLSPEQPLAPDDNFLLNYVVYHHFRSLGWVVRSGIKFAVDFLLYYRGPAFSHAEFAVLILPSYSHPYWNDDEKRKHKQKSSKDWWWLHAANRVQSQVRKSLVLVYVEVPPPQEDVDGEVDVGKLLKRYRVREFMLKRWSANRSR